MIGSALAARSDPSTVWITGVGTATPLGTTFPLLADSLLNGHSAIRRVASFDITDHPCQVASQLLEVPCPAGEDPVAFTALHRLEQLIRYCCIAALHDADLWRLRQELRIGLVLGVGAEWLELWESDYFAPGGRAAAVKLEGEPSVVERTRRALGLTGPVAGVSAAWARGHRALAQARTWLRLGWVDVCLAGGCDMAVSPMSLAAFGNLRALSRRNADPARASRPFDRERDGFVMGEGGAVFVLERAADVRAQGRRGRAELAGCGASSDAFNMVIPSSDPEPAAQAVRRALADAGLSPEAVDYVNAHATSTPVGDAAEARVLHLVFGTHTQKMPVSSTKSMTGHLLTGAAAVEAAACLAALERQAVPPTVNLDEPDPECDLCHVPHEAREHPVRVALSNSFGFGGSNTTVILRRVA
jgi:3-oxoacyl-[acyl-carrier-protein] synthase II